LFGSKERPSGSKVLDGRTEDGLLVIVCMEQGGEYPDHERELFGEELQPTAPTCSPQDTSSSCSDDHGGNGEVWEARRTAFADGTHEVGSGTRGAQQAKG
jgi:hypothetical protein